MSALGHKRTFCSANAMAALPPKADIERCVEMSAKCQKQMCHHSKISSAEITRPGGMVIPMT